MLVSCDETACAVPLFGEIPNELKLFIHVFQLPDIEIPLSNPSATIFSYVQRVALTLGGTKTERIRRVWEPTYMYVNV